MAQWYAVCSEAADEHEFELPDNLNHAVEESHHIPGSTIHADSHDFETHLSRFLKMERDEFFEWTGKLQGKLTKLIRKN